LATQGWLDLVCPLQPFSTLALCVARSPPGIHAQASHLVEPSRPAGEENSQASGIMPSWSRRHAVPAGVQLLHTTWNRHRLLRRIWW